MNDSNEPSYNYGDKFKSYTNTKYGQVGGGGGAFFLLKNQNSPPPRNLFYKLFWMLDKNINKTV